LVALEKLEVAATRLYAEFALQVMMSVYFHGKGGCILSSKKWARTKPTVALMIYYLRTAQLCLPLPICHFVLHVMFLVSFSRLIVKIACC